MIKTLRESKAKLSELVELAYQGEDVLITVRGKVKAKIVGVSTNKKIDMRSWALNLSELDQHTRQHTINAENILEDSREDRL